MKKLLLILFAIFSLTACHVEEPDTPPTLILKAVYPDGRPYPYASVDLYDSRYNYEHQINPVLSGETDRYGEMIIVDLYDIVYFFEVYDNRYEYDNYYDGAVFSTGYPLMYNSELRLTVRLLPK